MAGTDKLKTAQVRLLSWFCIPQAGIRDTTVASGEVEEGSLISRALLLQSPYLSAVVAFQLWLPFFEAKCYLLFKLQFRGHQLKSFVHAFDKYLLNAYFVPCIALGTGHMRH